MTAWGVHVVKDKGSRWLRWLTGRGHSPKSHPKSETTGCSRTSLIISPPNQGALQLLNVSKRKAEAGSSSSSPVSVTLHLRDGRGPAALALLVSLSEYGPLNID
jgi:hypothetical protein